MNKTQKLPLEGIRVVDLTQVWAGSYVACQLATMGAQVIKIEAIQRLDPWRGGGVGSNPPPISWERSAVWNAVNVNKLGITLDLSKPKGIEIFKKLVKIGDIVAENYTPRVMKNFGIDYPALKEINQGIIMISLPALGATGPWRDYTGFASSVEQMSGIPQLTGFPDGPPRMTDLIFSDAVVGVNGMTAILLALFFRQNTGKGQYIDLSQVETVTSFIGDAIAEYSMNKKIRPRMANQHPFMAPHGYYHCKGDDMWVGIAVGTDEEWRKFCKAIGNPTWTKNEKFADTLTRWKNREELDKLIEQWTSQHGHYEIQNMLQKAGVAAGVVPTCPEMLSDPHLKERGTYQPISREIVGTHEIPVPTMATKLSKCPMKIERPAPLLGEHNNYVFGEILGLSQTEIDELERDQIIGSQPLVGPSI